MDVLSQLIYFFSEYVMHFDRYIPAIMAAYGSLIYFLLFLILFCETGLVVTPFLPGDSLLFACGALSATANSLHFGYFFAICLAAAVLGDTCNYWIGEKFGLRILKSKNRLIKPEHVEKAQHFYEKHGHKAIFLCRFVPIVRTFAPFVAGIGTTPSSRTTSATWPWASSSCPSCPSWWKCCGPARKENNKESENAVTGLNR